MNSIDVPGTLGELNSLNWQNFKGMKEVPSEAAWGEGEHCLDQSLGTCTLLSEMDVERFFLWPWLNESLYTACLTLAFGCGEVSKGLGFKMPNAVWIEFQLCWVSWVKGVAHSTLKQINSIQKLSQMIFFICVRHNGQVNYNVHFPSGNF